MTGAGMSRLFALLLKEFKQTLRNKHLLYLLIVPPVIQLLILAASLAPQLHHVRLAFCDLSHSSAGRNLKEVLAGSRVFDLLDCASPEELTKFVELKKASAGVLIPDNFERAVFQAAKSGRDARDSGACAAYAGAAAVGAAPANGTSAGCAVDITLDGSDAYTASAVKAYIDAGISRFNSQYVCRTKPAFEPQVIYMYNRGLKASWYFIPGLLGAIITIVGVLVSSAVLLREKEQGTLEQLLMTPARSWEIVLSKILPIYVLLLADLILGLSLSMYLFALPFRGNCFLFFSGASLYILTAIGAGLILGTVCKTQRQAQLCSFFVSIPIVQLSGSVVPADGMPTLMQAFSLADPLKYFSSFTRAVLLKGCEPEFLLAELFFLSLFTFILLGIATLRFRHQSE